jgi:hypothetical protein
MVPARRAAVAVRENEGLPSVPIRAPGRVYFYLDMKSIPADLALVEAHTRQFGHFWTGFASF